jgi:hypothetical protein
MIERFSHREHMGFPLGNLYGLVYRMDPTADARATAEALRALHPAASRACCPWSASFPSVSRTQLLPPVRSSRGAACE